MPEQELRELKEMLYDLVIGISQWKNDFSEVPDLLYKGHLLFMKQAASSGIEVQNNLYDLLKNTRIYTGSYHVLKAHPEMDQLSVRSQKAIELFELQEVGLC